MTTLPHRASTTGFVGRSAKGLALVSLAVALRLATPPAPPARAVLLVLPGMHAVGLETLATEQGAWGGALVDREAGPAGGAFWRRFLGRIAQGDPVNIDMLGVPASLRSDDPGDPALAGGGFLGGNSGAVLEPREVALRRFPPAYGASADLLAEALEGLPRGGRSGWIVVPDGSGRSAGAFLTVRGGDEHWFFSPVHREEGVASEEASVSVASRPFFRGIAPELHPAVVTYLRALGDRRFQMALPSIRRTAPGGGVLLFDLTAEEVAEVFLPAETSTRIAEEVEGEVRSRIESLAASLGPEGLVVLAGGPHLGRADSAGAWYRVLPGSGAAVGSVGDLDLAAHGDLVLRYLLGESLGAADRALLPPELLARYPRRRGVRASSAPSAEPQLEAWGAAAIERVQASVAGKS